MGVATRVDRRATIGVPMRWTGIVAILFIAAMTLVIVGLLMFLLEVRVALRSVRISAAVLTGNVDE